MHEEWFPLVIDKIAVERHFRRFLASCYSVALSCYENKILQRCVDEGAQYYVADLFELCYCLKSTSHGFKSVKRDKIRERGKETFHTYMYDPHS